MKQTIQHFILIALVFATAHGCTPKKERAALPPSGPTPALHIPTPQIATLNNGLTLIVVENQRLPRVNIMLTTDSRPQPEGNKAGTAQLLSQLMGNATATMSKEEFNDQIDYLGAHLEFGDGSASAGGLSKFFPQLIQLLSDAILHPQFNPDEFEIARQMAIEEYHSQERDVNAITRRLFNKLTFGTSAYGEFATAQTLQNITAADIHRAHAETFIPNHAYLAVVGNVRFAEVQPLVEKYFARWEKGRELPAETIVPANPVQTEIDVVDIPDAAQTTITIGNLHNLRLNSPLFFAADISNALLGGSSLNTRLNSNLRERNAFTYGASSQISFDKYHPSFSAQAGVNNTVVARAIAEFMAEFARIDSISPADLELVKSQAKGAFTLSMENPSNIAGMEINTLTENLPGDFYENYLNSIDALTVIDVQNAAQQYIKPENLRILVVGKLSDFEKELRKLPYPVRYYDTKGNRVR